MKNSIHDQFKRSKFSSPKVAIKFPQSKALWVHDHCDILHQFTRPFPSLSPIDIKCHKNVIKDRHKNRRHHKTSLLATGYDILHLFLSSV